MSLETDLRYAKVPARLLGILLQSIKNAYSQDTAVTTATYACTIFDSFLRANTSVTGSNGVLTITLPKGSLLRIGTEITVKLTLGASIVTVAGNGADLIDGAATVTLIALYSLKKFRWSGTSWDITIQI